MNGTRYCTTNNHLLSHTILPINASAFFSETLLFRAIRYFVWIWPTFLWVIPIVNHQG